MNTKERQGQVKVAAVGKKTEPQTSAKLAFWLGKKSARKQYERPEGRIDFSEQNRPKKSKSVIALKYAYTFIFVTFRCVLKF